MTLEKTEKSLLSSLGDYRVLSILLLGFSAGIPLALIGSTLSMWLSRAGIDVKTIGLFALVAIPFSFKFLWAFLFDNIPLPYFSKRFGFRKSWLILSQLCLMLAIISLGQTSPLENISLTAIIALLVAFCSATQDIIIDALRIEVLEKEEQAIGASLYVYGYRIAMIFSGAGSLLLADHISWNEVFLVMGLSVFIGIIAVTFLKEPDYSATRLENIKKFNYTEMLRTIAWKPIAEFCQRPHWWQILLFIVFYKLADTMLISLQSKFYVTMGFSNSEIAYITKGLGFIMTLAGMFVGGVIYYKIGRFKSLLFTGILQILSNLFFIWVYNSPGDLMVLSTAIAVENLCGSMSLVVIVAYLSSLCNIKYTATQYALLSSVANAGRVFLAAPAGYLVDGFGWVNFFWMTAAAGIPGIILLFMIFDRTQHANN
jgi:MFS transporter, PAT family, beta-lactamase induction signal transducer AmpG